MMILKRYLLKLIDPQIIVLVVLTILICVLLTMFFSQRAPGFKANKKKFYIFVLSYVCIYILIAFLGYHKLFEKAFNEYVFDELCSVILGGFLCYAYEFHFNKFDSDKLVTEFLFAFVTVAFCIVPYSLVFLIFNDVNMLWINLTQFIAFFIPVFIVATYDKAIDIPGKIYKTWTFPEDFEDQAGVSDEEMRDLVVLTFLIKKKSGDETFTAYRAKGPTRIDFGRLFYNFILDYNDRHPNDTIQYYHGDKLYDWVFFMQSKWYESSKYVDPDLPLYMNGIEENSVILCLRQDEANLDDDLDFAEDSVDYEYSEN